MKRFAYVRSCLIRTSRAGLLSSVLKRCVAVALAYNTCVHIHTPHHTHTQYTLACDISIAACVAFVATA